MIVGGISMFDKFAVSIMEGGENSGTRTYIANLMPRHAQMNTGLLPEAYIAQYTVLIKDNFVMPIL